jgi:L-alanine-DL-glutamate epimerase-like enolase superfamily enzyme
LTVERPALIVCRHVDTNKSAQSEQSASGLDANNAADVALLRQLFAEGRPDPAHFVPPERPGLGVTMSADYVRDHSVDLATAERG